MSFTLPDYVAESNKIEGIPNTNTAKFAREVEAWREFLAVKPGMIHHGKILELANVLQPDAVLRDRVGLNVRVGGHYPPLGGPQVTGDLIDILIRAADVAQMRFPAREAFRVHCLYESLHPLTDCNGRTGRALWLWMMGGVEKAPLGFLHHWYYQSLDAQDDRA